MKVRILAAIGACLVASNIQAQVTPPPLVNYQGRVLAGGTNFDGAGQFKFALVSGNGATTYWSNDGTSVNGSQPANAVPLTVVKGLYSVLLGDTSLPNMTAVPASVFDNTDVRLRIWFNDGTHGSELLAPDQRIGSVGFAMVAGNVPDTPHLSAGSNTFTGSIAASAFSGNGGSLTNVPAASINFGTATLSGTLPVARGGTGLSSSGGNGNFLRSNGSSWSSAGLAAADLPAGSGNYIQNGTAQQSASFNVSGSGTVGGAFTANTVSASTTTSVVLNAASSSTIGSWLRLNDTAGGGHSWNIISSGSANSEGAGKLLFNDQTSGGTLMQLDSGGNLAVNGMVKASVPNAKARQTAIQTFANNAFVLVRLDEAQFSSGVTFDNANDSLVIVTPGLYQVTAELYYVPNATGVRTLEINSSSTGEIAYSAMNAPNGTDAGLNLTSLVRLTAGEAISLTSGQSSGGNLNTSVFNGRSATLSVLWVAQ